MQNNVPLVLPIYRFSRSEEAGEVICLSFVPEEEAEAEQIGWQRWDREEVKE